MQQELSIGEQVKQIGILYIALIAGQLLMATVLFFFVEEQTSELSDGAAAGSSMFMIIASFCVMTVGMSFFIYNKRKESGRQLEGLNEKLGHYRQSFMIRAGLIEGANLAALLVYFFVERNFLYLLLFAIGIAAFLLIRPTNDRIIEDYQLSLDEQSELRNSLK